MFHFHIPQLGPDPLSLLFWFSSFSAACIRTAICMSDIDMRDTMAFITHACLPYITSPHLTLLYRTLGTYIQYTHPYCCSSGSLVYACLAPLDVPGCTASCSSSCSHRPRRNRGHARCLPGYRGLLSFVFVYISFPLVKPRATASCSGTCLSRH